jgi:hypothetical protein
MNNEQPVVEITFDKENFESHLSEALDVTITDAQWASIASELEGRLWNFFEELLDLVKQDYEEGKYDEPETPETPEAVAL